MSASPGRRSPTGSRRFCRQPDGIVALLKQLVGTAVARLSRAGGVLAFHGVLPKPDPDQLNVTIDAGHFEALLEACQSVGELVALTELLDRHATGLSTARMIALTFDDAYASLLHTAAPILKRRAAPATAFVVARASRDGAAFWWDRLAAINAAADDERWTQFVRRIGVPDSFVHGPHQQYGRTHAVRQWVLSQGSGRLTGPAIDAFVEAEEACRCQAADRPMTFEQLDAFVAATGATLGPHTLTHPVVPLLSDVEATEEIGRSYRELLERSPAVDPYLAVPFGLFDRATAGVVKRAGLRGFLTLGGMSLAGSDENGEVPRVCISTSTEPLRLALRVSGLLDFRRPPRFPDMPTATT
jgi:peptidoglycan/xylan/chitin deacetylase (PgdA/CDA1 family)